MKNYVFYHTGVEHKTDNLAQFCKVNHLQRRHMHELIQGLRKSHKGWSMQAPDGTTDMEATLKTIKRISVGVWPETGQIIDGLLAGKPLALPANEYDLALITHPENMKELIEKGYITRA